jgi:hypothetical protein
MIKTVVDSFGQLNCGQPAQQLSNIFRKKSSKIQNVKLPTSGNINTHNIMHIWFYLKIFYKPGTHTTCL